MRHVSFDAVEGGGVIHEALFRQPRAAWSSTAEQIRELKNTVSDLRREVLDSPPDRRHPNERRQQELEDENINLKIRMRHMEEVVSALREHAASGQDKDSGLRAEMTALACETEQKQSELLQARREIVRVEAQLDQSRRHIDAAEAEVSSMRAQLSSARALNEKYLSLKGDLWPLLANDATFVDRQNGASGREKAGRGENSDQQLVCGLRKMREAYDRELERAFFLDSELEEAAKKIADLENELARRDTALGDLQSGLVNALQAVEHRGQLLPPTPAKIRTLSPMRRIDGVAQTEPLESVWRAHSRSPEASRLDERYLSAARTGADAEIAQASAEEVLQLRGRVELLQAELKAVTRKCRALDDDRRLAEDKLKIIQDEVADARMQRQQATQAETAERRERLIVEEKLVHQRELAKERQKKIEHLEMHLLNSTLSMRDHEVKRLQDVARAERLESELLHLQRQADTERQLRRVEKAEEEAREKRRRERESAMPKTSLEKRIMDRERRQFFHEEADRCASLEVQMDELRDQAQRDHAMMQERIEEQAKAAAKLSAKMLIERDRLLTYVLSALRKMLSSGRYAPSKVAKALTGSSLANVDINALVEDDSEDLTQPLTAKQFGYESLPFALPRLHCTPILPMLSRHAECGKH
jgi:chromosome segregation ATPase